MASATFRKPAMLAPMTKLPSWPYSLAVSSHVVEHAAHELLELAVDLLEGPGQVLGVLAHLQAGHEHAAGVGSLTGHRRRRRSPGSRSWPRCVVGMFAPSPTTLQPLATSAWASSSSSVFSRSAGQRDIAGKLPHAAAVALVPHGVRLLVNVHGERNALVVARALLVVDVLEHGVVDAVGILDPAVGIGAGEHLAAELRDLLDGVDGDVAGAVNDDVLALEGIAVALEVLVHEVDQAVAGGLGAGERAAEGEALAGEDAGPLVASCACTGRTCRQPRGRQRPGRRRERRCWGRCGGRARS